MIPDDRAFRRLREDWRNSLASDEVLRRQAVDLQLNADTHQYTYLREWCGVPVIRLPDDIVVLQEIIFSEKPDAVIEVGIARGGGLVLNASLMQMSGLVPRVLGVDIAIHRHTRTAIEGSRFARSIEMWEGDSTSEAAQQKVAAFVQETSSTEPKHLLILDSNHTEEHVLRELQLLANLLPVNSLVLVADTLIEEFPHGHYQNRSWDVGNNPMTAVNKFLELNLDFSRETLLGRRALISEFRDGIIRKVM